MMKHGLTKHPTLAFVAPFAVFIGMLGLKASLPVAARWYYPLQVLVVSGVLLLVSRPPVFGRPVRPLGSIILGLVVFALWVSPDQIWPQYRHHWLFENSLTGQA